MKKTNDKVLQRIFDIFVEHFEFLKKDCRADVGLADFNRYVVGAKYALEIALCLDYETCNTIDDFFDQKVNEYFGGQ